MRTSKDIKKQLPPYYKNDPYLNSFFNSFIFESNYIEKFILFYKNIQSIINCPENYLYFLEREEGLIEVQFGLLEYSEQGITKDGFIVDDQYIKFSYSDYTFKRRERLMAKNFIKVNTFNNINFKKMSLILGIDYVSLRWDKITGIVDILIARDEEIDEINSMFLIQMVNLWIPAHLKFGAIYNTLQGQVVSDFTYEELESKIYRNIEELIYEREDTKIEKGGIDIWLQSQNS